MQRRKFIAGLGSLAAAGAAGIGTGAFTSVSADRGVTVNVASDANAFLALEAEDTENGDAYVTSNGTSGTVSLSFDENASTEGGEGLNQNADTIIRDLLQVTNNGTQDVIVGVTGLPESMSIYTDDGEVAANGNSTSLNQDNYDPSSGNLALVGSGVTMDNVGVTFRDPASDLDLDDASITFNAIAVDELANPQDVRGKY
ncbi:hypothetical protein [Halobacterium sp. R2-5]|uniref:hypothetical protein n=1 Tax=Halobacterium sp. R2-5 TaxID=2715751 RepID=UPI0014239BC0|nr:hypothetical protein [Halobacterium sp. R2-5]NIB98090.1 hypothetical protein [Halobacterium sp. R2-5]